MKKLKNVLMICVAFALVAAITVATTIAYLTDRDSAVNIMTVGKVDIEQIEQERDENGELVDFSQNKPAYPAVGDVEWADEKIEINGKEYKVFSDELKNVVDKFVTVKNTGKNDAFVRTIVALEAPEGDPNDLIHVNVNAEGLTRTAWTYMTINGIDYVVSAFIYDEALAPKEISAPSLMQVFLDKSTTNEDCAKFGDTWEILVVSQGVQADGFDNAATALNEAFGEVTLANVTDWFNAAFNTVEVEGTNKAAVIEAINEAKDGDIIKLTDDVVIAGYNATEKLVIEKAIVLDLNGNTITTESGWGGIDAKGGCTIKNGTINHTGNTAAIKAFEVEAIENVTINVTETAGKIKGGIVVQGGNSYVGSIKNVTINGATNGIECYENYAKTAIGSMENVKINATRNGIYLNSGGIIGTITDCTITAGDTGIRGDLKGTSSIYLNLVNTTVSGNKYGVDLWDESPSNPGTVTFNYDAKSTFSGNDYGIKITLNAEVACVYQNKAQAKPCTIYVK